MEGGRMDARHLRMDALNVLIVDDHQNMRKLWVSILMSFGIKSIFEAESAPDALQVLKDEEIDLAIVDHILGDLTGTELIGLIRRAEDSAAPLLPIIACTADTRRAIVYSMINAGVDEILTKPVSPHAVWQRLVAITAHRRDFIRAPGYFGPDRRRADDPKYTGPERRGQFYL